MQMIYIFDARQLSESTLNVSHGWFLVQCQFRL